MMGKFFLFILGFYAIVFQPCSAGVGRWTSSGPYGGKFSEIVFSPQSNNVVFASGGNSEFGTDSALYRSSDGGLTWKPLNMRGIPRIHPQQPGKLLVALAGISSSTDSGLTWTTLYPSGSSRSLFYPTYDFEFSSTDPSTLYI